MNSIKRLSVAAAIFLVAQTALAVTPALAPHTAVYKVKISAVSGRLSTSLTPTDDGYVANHVIKPTGFSRIITRGTMDVTSEFRTNQHSLEPLRFQSIDTIRKDPDVDVTFDWNLNHVTGTVGQEPFEQTLTGLSYDSVSIQYALMHDLQKGTPNASYALFDVEKMRLANVRNVGSKTVKTKAGTYTAVGIQHQKEGSSRTVTMWCVEALGYLPVVIEQHRKGKLKFRASLVSYVPISSGDLSE